MIAYCIIILCRYDDMNNISTPPIFPIHFSPNFHESHGSPLAWPGSPDPWTPGQLRPWRVHKEWEIASERGLHMQCRQTQYISLYAPESSFIVDKIYNNGSQTLFTPACVGPLSVHLASTRLRVMVIYLLRNQLLTNKRILIDLCIKSV